MSRLGSMLTLPVPARCTTIMSLTVGHSSSASSALAFKGTNRPPRSPSSAVITMVDWQSWMRSRSDLAENPPNTTLWIAPMRAQASMEIASSGIIGR